MIFNNRPQAELLDLKDFVLLFTDLRLRFQNQLFLPTSKRFKQRSQLTVPDIAIALPQPLSLGQQVLSLPRALTFKLSS
ncbi:hypothetical protein [Nostoc sp. T09]|uniref:hypothetical protein n=1 Tax=Nostoc sp. T09 TaxID=1932621 RepID=UPI00117FBCAA|nr:hypothetical protein [Nostoc sp. T09]